MIETRSTPKQSETTGLWLVKIFTGPILIVLAFIHLAVNHYIGSVAGLLSHSEVVDYYQTWYIPLMEALFLVTVITHALLGLRGVVIDLKPSASTLKLVDWSFVVAGIGFTIYGLWLLAAIAAQG